MALGQGKSNEWCLEPALHVLFSHLVLQFEKKSGQHFMLLLWIWHRFASPRESDSQSLRETSKSVSQDPDGLQIRCSEWNCSCVDGLVVCVDGLARRVTLHQETWINMVATWGHVSRVAENRA